MLTWFWLVWGDATPRIGGSRFEMWFAATISPPLRGTLSAPTTEKRTVVRKTLRTTILAKS